MSACVFWNNTSIYTPGWTGIHTQPRKASCLSLLDAGKQVWATTAHLFIYISDFSCAIMLEFEIYLKTIQVLNKKSLRGTTERKCKETESMRTGKPERARDTLEGEVLSNNESLGTWHSTTVSSQFKNLSGIRCEILNCKYFTLFTRQIYSVQDLTNTDLPNRNALGDKYVQINRDKVFK